MGIIEKHSGKTPIRKWCAIGDSFTYLGDHLEETLYRMEKGYIARTAQKLPFPVEVINLGLNGSTTCDWIHVPVAKADFYTILLGTNDWFHNTAPTGTQEDFQAGRAGTILGNLGCIVRHIRDLDGSAQTAPVFIMNPTERGDFVYLLDPSNTAHGSYAPEGGRWLRDLAADIFHGVVADNVIPINLHDEAGFTQENAVHFKRTAAGDLPFPAYIGVDWSIQESGHPYPKESMWFTYDGLHPSPVGCEAIAQVLAQRICAWYEQNKG